MPKFDITQNWTATEQGPGQLEMQTPTRAPGIASDLVVPFGQAMITGGLLSGLVTFISARAGYDGELLALWFGLALFIGTVTWIFLLVDTRRLLRQIEKLTGLDIDGDGKVGNPQDRIVLVNADKAREEAQQHAQAQERASMAAELSEFVARLPQVGTDQRTWEKRIGRDKYQAFRDALLEMGWAEWNSPRDKRRGWRLVLPVRQILGRISGE
jgi:hypothetical protein